MGRIMDIYDYLILAALAAVVITLGFGLYALSYSNKLMRLRVLLQFIAVVIIVAAFYAHRH